MIGAYIPKPSRNRAGYYYPQKKAKAKSLRYELIYDGAVALYPDGREVCLDNAKGRIEYKRRLNVMLIRQNGKCCLCKRPLGAYNATFEHKNPRGMAGARRDDRIEDANGEAMNGAAHWDCNGEKGSRRIP